MYLQMAVPWDSFITASCSQAEPIRLYSKSQLSHWFQTGLLLSLLTAGDGSWLADLLLVPEPSVTECEALWVTEASTVN